MRLPFMGAVDGSDYAPEKLKLSPAHHRTAKRKRSEGVRKPLDKYNILTEISRERPEQCFGAANFLFAAYNCAVYEK